MSDGTLPSWEQIKANHRTSYGMRSHPNPGDGYLCSECRLDSSDGADEPEATETDAPF